MALLVLRRVGLCVGQNQMCHLCGWLKEILNNAKGGLFLPFLSQGNMEKGNSDKDSLRVLSTQDDFWELFKEDSLWSFRSKHGYVPMLWNNLKRQATSPLRMTEGQAFFLMGAAGLTASLYYFDGDIDKKFRPLKDENPWLEQTSPHLTELGDYYGYSFLVISGIYSLAAKNHKLLHTTILASQSALSAGIWSRVGKMLTGRMRPGATYGDKEYNSDHWFGPVSYTHLRAHETVLDLVCRLLLEKKKQQQS